MQPIAFNSKLPQVGTTIFTVMSQLAQQHGAVNLGQGFPDFEGDPALHAEVSKAMMAGHNQYAPMAGAMRLREAIAQLADSCHGACLNPASEITITAGATQAIMTAVLCCVHPGDEVVVIEPAFDCYAPAIELAGGVMRRVGMVRNAAGEFELDWAALSKALKGTGGVHPRLLMINSPHNPTGVTLKPSDLDRLADCLRNTHTLVLSDEVYEHMVYDGQKHMSLLGHEELRARSFVVSSFGKTHHVTGWKLGFCAAPALLMQEFQKVHQFNVFAVNHPMQMGLANYLQHSNKHLQLAEFYQEKRDFFKAGLANTGLRSMACEGAYFQVADFSALCDWDDVRFCNWLTEHVGVAAIPMSSFYSQHSAQGLVRFCFAKQKATLEVALDRLQRLPQLL